MPWKDRYTISDEKSLLDSEVTWPDGNRCCFRIVVDLAPPCGPAGITPQDLTTPDAYYGMHGGLSGLSDILRRRRLKATFAVPAVIADIHADTIRALREEGHEIAAHGFKHEDVSLLGQDEERVRLQRTTEILTRVAGARPAGWFSLPRPSDKFAGGAVSGHTVDLLIRGRLRLFRQWPGRRRAALLGD
jgi:peptidoglycan/xylan/chitin deacetylase (PgdA/CDA1 family)